MTKSSNHIGSKEFISFPSVAIEDVPAKVDTGADSSSVWATDIKEEEKGGLSFKLFGQGSKHYSGGVVFVDAFKITQIKNSFGHQEERYKVQLPVKIAGRLIKTEFTLADRSRNRYPVLIGRRTLSNRFIVDVSKDNTHTRDDLRRVLLLTSKPSKKVRALVNNMNGLTAGLEVDYSTYDDLVIQLGGSTGIEITNILTGAPLSEYDLIYFKTYFKAADRAAAVAEYAQLRGINFIDSEVAEYHSYTKLSQYARLVRFGLPVPKSLIVSYKYLLGEYGRFQETLGLPFVLKDAAADRGESNFLVKTEAEFEAVAHEALLNKSMYIGQEFIANEGDYRVLVFDKDVKFAIKRSRLDDETHLNNTSRGGTAELIELADIPSEVVALGVRGALAMGRQVAGVDLIENSELNEWMILEVNNSPELAGGSYTDRKASELGEFLLHFAEK